MEVYYTWHLERRFDTKLSFGTYYVCSNNFYQKLRMILIIVLIRFDIIKILKVKKKIKD